MSELHCAPIVHFGPLSGRPRDAGRLGDGQVSLNLIGGRQQRRYFFLVRRRAQLIGLLGESRASDH